MLQWQLLPAEVPLTLFWLLLSCGGLLASTHLASPMLATRAVLPTSHTATQVAPSVQLCWEHSCSSCSSVLVKPCG